MPEQPATDTAQPQRLQRWLRVLLFASLAFNLLTLGMVGGAMLSRRGADLDREAAMLRDLGLGPYLRALSPEDRDALRRAAEGEIERLRDRRSEVRATFAATLAALRAEPFDAGVFGQLIETQALTADRGRALGQDLLVGTVAGMSTADRSALADRLETAIRRYGPPHKR